MAGAAAATVAAPLWAQSSAKSIVLGQSAAFSGPAAQLGEQFKRGALLFFDRLNAKGGVNGRTIELKSLDDGYEPDRCKANTDKLIKDGVFALFGYIGTPTSLAALPLASAAQVPFIAPFTGAQALREPFNRIAFHVRASYFDETAEIVKQVTSIGAKRIAVFHQNDYYGKAGLDGVLRALKPLNLEPAGLGTVERNTVDVAAAVKSILAGKPDAIVQISAYKSCAAFIREARKAGYGGAFYNVSFVGTKALADELGADARGVIVSQVMPYPYSPVSHAVGRVPGRRQGHRRRQVRTQLQQHRRLRRRQDLQRGLEAHERRADAGDADRRPGIAARAQPGRLLRRLQRHQAHGFALRRSDDPVQRRQGSAIGFSPDKNSAPR